MNIGEEEFMPTLDEVLTLLKQAPKMLINIEVKAPAETPAIFEKYDYKEACEIVNEHIIRHGI